MHMRGFMRIKKAIPGKDGFVGLREDCASGLWVKHISTWGKNGQNKCPSHNISCFQKTSRPGLAFYQATSVPVR